MLRKTFFFIKKKEANSDQYEVKMNCARLHQQVYDKIKSLFLGLQYSWNSHGKWNQNLLSYKNAYLDEEPERLERFVQIRQNDLRNWTEFDVKKG